MTARGIEGPSPPESTCRENVVRAPRDASPELWEHRGSCASDRGPGRVSGESVTFEIGFEG